MLLEHLFGSTESTAKEIELDDAAILKIWKGYVQTLSKKRILIEGFELGGDLPQQLLELRKLLDLELTDIRNEEREETELLSDLEAVEHDKKVKRIHKLEQCLCYVETKYEYVYRLLQELHQLLKSQIHLAEKLIAGSKDAGRLISHIKLQCELEQEIVKKIEQRETFHDLFLALVKGEHIVRSMNAAERKLVKRMQEGMKKIFSNQMSEGVTYEWAMAVFNGVEDAVHEAVAKGMFPGYHPDIDFEYVNRPEFVDFARETLQQVRKRAVSEQMVTAFVHLFREWYNHERD